MLLTNTVWDCLFEPMLLYICTKNIPIIPE